MTPEREQEVERICQGALELPILARDQFLTAACKGDERLRAEIDALLALEEESAGFLESPALTVAAWGTAGAQNALTAGRQFGSYTIVSPIGMGGMGEVYRAHDAALNRDVAIKVLPAVFTSDLERLARLTREARVLASLNHPNIATIHGLEIVDGIRALVLEMVEGPMLSERLGAARTGLPMAEALGIARQLAAALGAAHERGIVHRDLKPANIKIRPEGVVKVLDFGLAKAVTPAERDEGPRVRDPSSPPLEGRTREGVLLGTAGYMSPEQARGEVVDKRADIWAFGCLLYEMLTGRSVFAAASIADTLSAVLRNEPEWHRLPTDTPDSVRRLLRRCLAKDRSRRLTDIHDALLDLDDFAGDELVSVPLGGRARRLERVAWTAALLLMTVVVTTLVVRWERTSLDPPPQVRFDIDSAPTAYPDTLAISPDGTKVVFAVTADDGRSGLWMRRLAAAASQPLPGTEGGRAAFWSPDSRSVGFFANGSLKRIDVETRTVLALAKSPDLRSGTWNGDGTIFFSPGTGSLFQLSDRGGPASAIGALSGNGIALMHPRFLPDGRHLLYDGGGDGRGVPRGIHVAQRDGSGQRRLLDGASADYVPSGYLLYLSDRSLFANQFDLERLAVTGSPVHIADRVMALSVAGNGTVVFRSGDTPRRALVWHDRSGAELGRVPGPGGSPAISPDGRRVAVARIPPDRTTRGDISMFDLGRQTFSNVTGGPFANTSPLWAPDGERIVFASPRNGKPFALYLRPAAGGGEERLLLEHAESVVPNSWSPDGRFLIYRRSGGTPAAPTNGVFDLWVLSIEKGTTYPLVQTEYAEREAQFSPDGRWFAYQSNDQGRFEIYIKPFPDDGTRRQLSSNGGVQVRWRGDGRELFYVGLDDVLMAVPIDLTSASEGLPAGRPMPLFRSHVGAGEGVGIHDYDVSRDGTKFLINALQDVTAPITAILNWAPGGQKP